MSVILDDPNQTGSGPIQSIILDGTDASSSLTIKVKRVGDGLANVESIQINGQLKSISGKTANLVGSAGINANDSIGSITLANILNSKITLTTNGASTVASPSLGKVTLTGSLSNSVVNAPSITLMTVGSLIDSIVAADNLSALSVKGAKGSTLPAYVNSSVMANALGTFNAASLQADNSGHPFGVFAKSSIGSVVGGKLFTWNPSGPTTQTYQDFRVTKGASALLPSSTRLVSDADAQNATPSETSLTFPANAPSIQDVAQGDILAGSTGSGLLVRVTSVTTNEDGSVQLGIDPASVADAVQLGVLATSYEFQPSDLVYTAPGVTVSNAQSLSRQLASLAAASIPVGGELTFNLNNVSLFANSNIRITQGSLRLTPSVILNAAFDLGGLKSAEAGVGLGVNGQLTVVANIGAGLSRDYFTNVTKLAEWSPTGTMVTLVGGFPVVWKPVLKVNVGVEAGISCDTTFNGSMTGNILLDAAWNRGIGWQNLSQNTLNPSGSISVQSIEGSVRVYIQPQVEIILYGSGGTWLREFLLPASRRFS